MEEQDNTVGLKVARFSVADLLKILGVIVMIVAAWARVESGLAAVNRRLDSIDTTQAVYVRGDVAQARQETLLAKLDALGVRLAQLESKLDK